jgi:hypothetical protein
VRGECRIRGFGEGIVDYDAHTFTRSLVAARRIERGR